MRRLRWLLAEALFRGARLLDRAPREIARVHQLVVEKTLRAGGRVLGCGCLDHDAETCAIMAGGEWCECPHHYQELVEQTAVETGFAPDAVREALRAGYSPSAIIELKQQNLRLDSLRRQAIEGIIHGIDSEGSRWCGESDGGVTNMIAMVTCPRCQQSVHALRARSREVPHG